MSPLFSLTRYSLILCTLSWLSISNGEDPVDASQEQQSEKLKVRLQQILKSIPEPTGSAADSVQVWSARGDALFYLGRFDDAVEAYEKMVELNPELKTSHWRLGIAYFFDDRPQEAVQIFEAYHSYDDVDRENGIWRYLSQYRATDAKTAQRELLKYEKDDREPFPAVYRMFAGELTPDEVLKSIPDGLTASAKGQQVFYSRLYCGLCCVVQKQPAQALQHLEVATASSWPQKAGYGPHFMWHVGRLQRDLLKQNATKESPKDGP